MQRFVLAAYCRALYLPQASSLKTHETFNLPTLPSSISYFAFALSINICSLSASSRRLHVAGALRERGQHPRRPDCDRHPLIVQEDLRRDRQEAGRRRGHHGARARPATRTRHTSLG
eukprot:4238357-Pleurochrysis_carterae.AAC.3